MITENKLYRTKTLDQFKELTAEAEKMGYKYSETIPAQVIERAIQAGSPLLTNIYTVGRLKHFSVHILQLGEQYRFPIRDYKNTFNDIPRKGPLLHHVLYHAPTQEAFDKIVRSFRRQGITWQTGAEGANYRRIPQWETHKQFTAIVFNKKVLRTKNIEHVQPQSYYAYQESEHFPTRITLPQPDLPNI